jgi:hypothetical protein
LSLLLEELPEELPDELLDELLDELPDELLVLSSELEAARRNLGWSPLPAELPAELLEELLEELSPGLPGRGRDVSSAASDAIECSSAVPSLTSVIFTAW